MNEHLKDEQLTSLLDGVDDPLAREHLAHCTACGEELEGIKTGIAGFAAVVHQAAVQRRLAPVAIGERRGLAPHLAWAFALLLIAAASLLHWGPAPPPPTTADFSADDQLLLEVQQDLYREVPQALAPAMVLTAERNRIILQQTSARDR